MEKPIRFYQTVWVLPACYSEEKSCLPSCKPLGFGDRNVTNLVNVLSVVIIKWLCQLANPWIWVQAPVTWWEGNPCSWRQSPSLSCSLLSVKFCLHLVPYSEREGIEKPTLIHVQAQSHLWVASSDSWSQENYGWSNWLKMTTEASLGP